MYRIFLILLLACPVFAGVWTYDVTGYMDFKTNALRDTTYNTIILYTFPTSYFNVYKSDFSAQTGTTTATAFYRITICANYTIKEITKRDNIDTALNSVILNSNVKACNIKLFDAYCKVSSETAKLDIAVKEYIK
jgi:hypothetical protein